MKNTSSRQEFYRKNGYWIERQVFSPEECDLICTRMRRFANYQFAMITNPDRPDFLIAQGIKNLADEISRIEDYELGKKADLIEATLKTSRDIRNVITDRRFVSILEEIIGQEMIALTSQFFFKQAGSPYAEQAFNPHQDNVYLNIKKGCAANTQLMLSKSNRENGAMYVIPGSHQEDILPYEDLPTYGEEARKKPGRKCIIPDKYKGQELDLSFEKGDFLIIDGNLIHGSHPNYSNQSRPVFAWQTCTKIDARPALENRGENARRMEIVLR